ncbi:MAG: mannosyltransferase [Thermodesulfobacteriota bacterium]
MSKTNAYILLIICLLGLWLRVGLGLLLPNIMMPDEIFQTLEQAHRLAYGYGIIPWEFWVGLRNWLLPMFLASVMYSTGWLAEGSTGYLIGVVTALSLLSLTPVVVAYRWGERVSGTAGAIIAASVCAVWFEFVYFAPKALSGVVATYALIPGLYLGCRARILESRKTLLWSGILLGTVLALRFHLAPAVLFAFVWICRADWRGKWAPMTAGFLIPVLVMGLLDWLTWSYPFQSVFLNIRINIFEGKSEIFGVSPWYGYLKMLYKIWSWGMAPIVVLAVLGASRYPLPAFVALIILLTFSIVPHKEYRFLFPVMSICMLLAGLGAAEVYRLISDKLSSTLIKQLAATSFVAFFACLSLVLAPELHPSKTMYPGRLSHWHKHMGSLKGFELLSKEPNVCGVGIQGISWVETGGYAYLHRDVPLFQLNMENFTTLEPGFNFLLVRTSEFIDFETYSQKGCWYEICLYEREGGCTKVEGYHIKDDITEP